MTALAERAPAHHQFEGGDPQVGLKELRHIIEHAITHQPRSLQRTIGPSEIGTPCDHCLAAKLACWERTDDGVPWLPYVGTAVHAQLEELVTEHERARDALANGGYRYLTEARVMVGHILGKPVWGSTDLLDLLIGMTVDWKIVGASTLRTAKAGPSPVYRAQAHLYAKGWNDAGYRVEHVAIAYLPRNETGLDKSVMWSEPFNRQIAVDALDRANRFATNLAALATLGEAAVTAWISSLPRAPHCYDCARYTDRPVNNDGIDGLIAPPAAIGAGTR